MRGCRHWKDQGNGRKCIGASALVLAAGQRWAGDRCEHRLQCKPRRRARGLRARRGLSSILPAPLSIAPGWRSASPGTSSWESWELRAVPGQAAGRAGRPEGSLPLASPAGPSGEAVRLRASHAPVPAAVPTGRTGARPLRELLSYVSSAKSARLL